MKRVSCAIALGFLVSSLMAAEMAPPAVNVALAVSPANGVTRGSPITLTATVTAKKPFPAGRIETLASERLRYTFTAQRTWPCADPAQRLTQNVANATLPWTPLKGGIYTFGVEVTYVAPKLVEPGLKVGEKLGTASVANYNVKPSGFGHNSVISYSPSSGSANAPASVTVSVSLTNPPPIMHRFIYKYFCLSGNCGGQSCTHDVQSTSDSCTFNNLPAGQYNFQINEDEVDPQTCDWIGSGFAHDYSYYTVKP